jgi:cytochrome c oxidase assembly protein subunit 19
MNPAAQSNGHKKTAPALGSFPLDRKGRCKEIASSYLRCLRRAEKDPSHSCRSLAKEYLQCRMDSELMEAKPLENFGFPKNSTSQLEP